MSGLDRMTTEAVRRYYQDHHQCAGHDIGPALDDLAVRAYRAGLIRGLVIGLLAAVALAAAWVVVTL